MNQWVLCLLAVAMMISAIYLIIRDKRETEYEELRLKKMRGGDMYREIYEKLSHCKICKLEKLEIREDCVTFRYFMPEPRESRYVFSMRGFRPLNEEGLHTLALLIETDHEDLRDSKRYRFSRRIKHRLNGSKTHVYAFVIRPAYKDALCRSPYYSGKPQDVLSLKRNI